MELKLYVDRMSQPSRAILIFCKANGIAFEEVKIELAKKQHHSPEFAEVNPMKQVPAIVHGDFKLFESNAILIYLASAFSEVADHWYPADVRKRAKIHSVLDWHHSNLRRGSVGYIFNDTIALAFGAPLNPKAAAEGEKLLSASLTTIETYWLEGDKPFLLGNSEPSIADVALVCEIMQLEMGDDNDHERILGPHERALKWIDDTKNATAPYFDEIHAILPPVKEKLKELKLKVSKQSA
ncbi:Glutathione S-transferase theta-1 [Castilleja foliolosa]|uniref:glutathione transferase n=1 Tax=Castilleja foliolosa TaxID=1961234 RepID=A0ABD3EE04_9LAMI